MAKKGQGKQGEFEIPKHTKMEADEEEIEDLEELLEEPVRGKKCKMMSLYTALGKDEFVTGSKDQKSRLIIIIIIIIYFLLLYKKTRLFTVGRKTKTNSSSGKRQG